MLTFDLKEDFLKSPAEMSDDELRREYAALFRIDNEVMPDERLSGYLKYQLSIHAKLVLDEYQIRFGETIASPFRNFKIF